MTCRIARRFVLVMTVGLLAGGSAVGCWKNNPDDERDASKQTPTDGESTDDGDQTGTDGDDSRDTDRESDASGKSLSEVDVSLAPAFQGRSFSQPVWAMQFPGTPNRWFVVEQAGRIITFATDSDGTETSVWADITGRVIDGGERGLLGMAIHPDWPERRIVYLSYTTNEPGELTSRISEFEVQPPEGDDDAVGAFQADSEDVLLEIAQPYGNHNGGQITFGPDGFLYAGYGDGGSGGDPEGNGQDPSTLLGAMLRIDPTAGNPYEVPDTNPFAGDGTYQTDEGNTVEGAKEVFAWGLRNPWRWSFDAETGALWAGDVGQNQWEEIDIVEKGENYGWNIKEATHCYAEDPCDGPYEEPVTEYGRDLGKSVTGGYVYRGETHEALQGVYLFADYLSGRIWGVPNVESGRPYDRVELVDTDKAISSFAQGLDGEIYVIGYGGSIYRLNVSG